MTSSHKRYRVTITTWSAYQIDLSATNQSKAAKLAERTYEDDCDQFHYRDGGITDIFVEET